MKAAQISGYGETSVLVTSADAPKPSAEAGHVIVAVQAAAANPFDLLVISGGAQQMAQLSFPATLGGDLAGTVAEIGEGVVGFSVGQQVYGMANAIGGHGSFAEFAPVKATQLSAKPESLDYANAAAVPLVGASAYQALVTHLQLQPNQKILVHGGAGGIGSVAVQIAKQLGAYVAATAAASDVEFVKSLGADEVIDYQTQDFAEIVHDYDAVFDTVGGETATKSYAVLKPGGTIVSMTAHEDPELSKAHNVTFISQFTQMNQDMLAAVTGMIDSGALHVRVDKVFPLEAASEALEYLKTGHPHGKVVIQVSAT
jgi:alcohol dehydrogenase